MGEPNNELTEAEKKRFSKCPVSCPRVPHRVGSLGDYLTLLSSMLSDNQKFWFRGHRKVTWGLTPSALRFAALEKRNAALALLSDFRRVADIKLGRPPYPNENLKWLQLAQHYGIPTRLLDWTESATFALYFACEPTKDGDEDGLVFLLNPLNLQPETSRRSASALDGEGEAALVERYLRLDGREKPRSRLGTVAINPVWNSERLMLQRGVFTLHGAQKFTLDKEQAPSLVGIPILKEVKPKLRRELARTGVDEMTIFPELEHACCHLRRIGLGEES